MDQSVDQGGDGPLQNSGGPSRRREDDLAWKVAMQRQMLEQQDRQQHMQSGSGPGSGGANGSGGPQDEDLMMKVRQQQQLLDMEKQREAQQKLMEQQQLALLEAQRGEQQQRRLPGGQGQPMAPAGITTASPIRSSGVSMVSAPMQGPPRGLVQHQGMGAPLQQGGPQGQPPMSQGGPPPLMSQGGPPPLISQQGGPPPLMSQQTGPPPLMSQGGPRMPQAPPLMSQGGPMQQGGPPMSQGGPMQQGGQSHMSQSGPMQQGGPSMSQGQSQMSQGGPMQQGGPPMSQGGQPHMTQSPMQQGGPPMSQGGPPGQMMMQSGPRPFGMGERPPMHPPGERPSLPQGGPGGHMQPGPSPQGGPQQHMPPPLMGQPLRPQGENVRGGQPGQGEGSHRDASGQAQEPTDTDLRPRIPPGPYNGPSTPVVKPSVAPAAPSSAAQGPKEMRLPQALEKMLEFKSQRAHEVGIDLDNMEDKEGDADEEEEEEDVKNTERKDDVNEEEEYEDDNEDAIDTKEQTKESKNKRKKKKKKKARRNRFELQKKSKKKKEKSKAPEVQIEYIQEQLELDPGDPSYNTFAKIFEAFKITEPEKPKEIKVEEESLKKDEAPAKIKGFLDDDDDDDDDDEDMKGDEDGPKISKKKLKKLTRLTVAQLKQLVSRPDVVEMHDVTARDPRLLVHLKATRNTVPVPRHWCYKRKYLQGKRGIEKTPFELPDFIKATGIEEMRAALQEKEDQKTLKSKMREKVRPKMGKIDIDYQKLHDAFFRFQTKPKMTIHGDLYYETKEFETKLREKKPGNLSDDLKMALGMPIGTSSEKVPPPWLIAMQRYGPPPSYPNLKIAGLNAPIPEGCMFGYHAGGWGKPPVDETGKPLYGDVFGTQGADFKNEVEEEEVDKTVWGELESESESESESEEEEEEEKDETGLITPAEGLMTPSGITSVPVGLETPEQIELRKKRIEDAMDQGGDTPALYQVLPEKKGAPIGGAMMGSAHVYDISAAVQNKPGKTVTAEAVEVSLNPEELDLDTAAMQAKYEQTVREQQSQLEKEDLSDMVAAHAAKQRKRKKAQQDTSKGAKKYKDFKF